MTYSVHVNNNELIVSGLEWDKALEVCAKHAYSKHHVVLVLDRVVIAGWKNGQAIDVSELPIIPL